MARHSEASWLQLSTISGEDCSWMRIPEAPVGGMSDLLPNPESCSLVKTNPWVGLLKTKRRQKTPQTECLAQDLEG